ncbi:SAM-dependent methyltransferase [Hyphobacterium sp. CCMP332]|nr:SAM-dependent methyltransferase [Hyphobacterium sp. CCMP332]
MAGNIYLIPTPISEEGYGHLAEISKELITTLELFFVENQKNSRRFIKTLHPEAIIDNLEFVDIGKYSDKDLIQEGLQKVWLGKNAAILSDVGCPGIGDPGHELILEAQDSGVRIIPLAGPNSFMMALMASGLNGQEFRFHGYLPIDKNQRKAKLKSMSADALNTGESQIFMDTPYRNQQVLSDIIQSCPANVNLCIAEEITGKKESILTMPVKDWKKINKKIDKHPAVFILG